MFYKYISLFVGLKKPGLLLDLIEFVWKIQQYPNFLKLNLIYNRGNFITLFKLKVHQLSIVFFALTLISYFDYNVNGVFNQAESLKNYVKKTKSKKNFPINYLQEKKFLTWWPDKNEISVYLIDP